jgi:flagellar basal body-associated protein FliL
MCSMNQVSMKQTTIVLILCAIIVILCAAIAMMMVSNPIRGLDLGIHKKMDTLQHSPSPFDHISSTSNKNNCLQY